MLLLGREVDGVERGERLAVLVREEVMEDVAEKAESRLGLLRTTPPGEAGVGGLGGESADWALVRPGEVGGGSEELTDSPGSTAVGSLCDIIRWETPKVTY